MFHLDQKSLEHFSEKKNVPLSVCCVILEDHMKDRREITRTRVKRNVKVIIADRVPPFTCTVRDLTTKGAGLSIPTTQSLPTTFELSF